LSERDPDPSFIERHGITAGVLVRLGFVVSILMIVGVRFERTIVALAISAVFVTVFTVLGRAKD